MVKRLLLASSALLAPALASAQTTPPDVGTYSPQTWTYATGATLNILGDGSNDKGGTAPAFTTLPEPAAGVEINDKSIATWTSQGWLNSEETYCTVGVPDLATCPEKKIRIQFNSSKILRDDPIRLYGQPGASHPHEFFGVIGTNAYSTRLSLRTRCATTGPGGCAWGNGYWQPAWLKDIAGKTYGILSALNTVYYVESGTSPNKDDMQPLHYRLRFIFGRNADDPMDCKAKNEINKGNGGPGTGCNPVVNVATDRYIYKGDGFEGYQCSNANGSVIRPLQAGLTSAPGFRLSSGTTDADDPWYVAGVHGCGAGDTIYSEAHAPKCWDGVNVWVPGGYDNFRKEVADSVTGADTCATGKFKVPSFYVKDAHTTQGWTDYQKWYLASDAMFAAKCTALGETCPIVPGWSFHADWMNGIPIRIRDQAFGFCLGIGTNAPHQCNAGGTGDTIGVTLSLITNNAPDGSRSPQVGFVTIDTSSASNLILVDTARGPTHDMKGM